MTAAIGGGDMKLAGCDEGSVEAPVVPIPIPMPRPRPPTMPPPLPASPKPYGLALEAPPM